MTFEYKLTEKDQEITIELHGRLDEHSNFEEIKNLEARTLNIDLKNVTLMNSIGLRNWIQWNKTLNKIPVIFLSHCPSIAMNQLSILDGFLPLGATINSFEVPFHCDHCEFAFSKWVERKKDYLEASLESPGWNKIQTVTQCPECKNEAEIDAVPVKYFRFLTEKV